VSGDGTIPVRPGEELDAGKVLAYLRERLPELPEGELEVRQFPTGASNLTYLIEVGPWQAVLRRPPVGPVPPKAHDMLREASILAKLNPVFPLAPRPYHICDDLSVLGVPFSVLEYRRGMVIDTQLPPGVDASFGRQLSANVLDVLLELHSIDYRAAGLEEIGFPQGFLERQTRGWIGRYEKARTDEIAVVEPLTRWLASRVPPSPAATVIHNDYKLNNLLFDREDPSRIVAVLDWEMATVGDPLFDLAIFLSYWSAPEDPPSLHALRPPSISVAPGFPSRAEMMERYARASGRELAAMDWHMAFAFFKLAVILQQIYARYVRGQTQDPRFAGFGAVVRELIVHAHELTLVKSS
jgi:aminoglycoside phosphotransferase (APT) family kinase protein